MVATGTPNLKDLRRTYRPVLHLSYAIVRSLPPSVWIQDVPYGQGVNIERR